MTTEIAVRENRGLQLTSFEQYQKFAEMVAESGLAPKGLEKPASIMVALQMGAELGMSPMASLQNIAVINGRPSVWGDAQLAVCRASGVFDESQFEEHIAKDGDQYVATSTVCRRGGKPITRRFAMGDAQRAGLVNKGPWQQYPFRMLQMRARSWALRDGFADVLRGFPVAEEMRDGGFQDVEPSVDVATNGKPARSTEKTQPETIDDLTEQLATPDPEPVPEPEPELVDNPSLESGQPAAETNTQMAEQLGQWPPDGRTHAGRLYNQIQDANCDEDIESAIDAVDGAFKSNRINLARHAQLIDAVDTRRDAIVPVAQSD